MVGGALYTHNHVQNVGLMTDERGRVQVDGSFRTSVPR